MASNTVETRNFIPFTSIYPSEYFYRWFTIHIINEKRLAELSSNRRNRRTHPIQQYPCRVYLIDHDSSKESIRVWLEESEVDIEKCSDYMYEKYSAQRMKPCWVCKWIEIDKDWTIDYSEEINETIINKSDFYRLHGDEQVHYGDGGYSFLVYPVWIQEHLPITESRRQRLLNVFYRLNNERRDFHPAPSPVEDIIDPDLLAYPPPTTFDRDRWIARRLRHLEKLDESQFRHFKRDLRDGEYNDLSEHEQLRDTYQWLPSDFVIDRDGKVDILSPIHHLPAVSEHRQTYGDIAHIFHAMLPMFEKLKLIKCKADQEQRLQVIVKAQSYNLKAGMKYSGRWHTEGHTENIVAVGVYYLHVDDQLEGGTLKFRPKVSPSSSYDGIETDYEVTSVQSGTAVVFSNAIPHRFRQIRNLTTDDGRRRTFLNFFIVDPDQPIELNWNQIIHAPRNMIIDVLRRWNDGRLPDLILEKIMTIIQASMWKTDAEAKEFRSRVRRAMVDERSGWGWICWGNCGTTEFVRALCTWEPRRKQEAGDRLNHTESDQ